MRYGKWRFIRDLICLSMIFGGAISLAGEVGAFIATGAIGILYGIAEDLRSEINPKEFSLRNLTGPVEPVISP